MLRDTDNAMLVSDGIRVILRRALDANAVVAHGPAETVAVKELAARGMLRPLLSCNAYRLTEAGTCAAREIGAP